MKKAILIALLIMVVIAIPVSLFSWSSWATITVDPAVKVIGYRTPVKIHLDNPHGERTLTVTTVQDGKSYKIATTTQPAKHFVFCGP